MGPEMNVWHMVVDLEREIALTKAARFGPMGEPRGRRWRLPALWRRAAPLSQSSTSARTGGPVRTNAVGGR